jgi:hypothetical protein
MTRTVLSITIFCLTLAACACDPNGQNSNGASGTPAPAGSATPVAQGSPVPSRTPRPPDDPRYKLHITAPADSTTVTDRPFVEGTIADQSVKEVWVVIHPTAAGDYWAQQPASVRDDGTWRVQVYVGEPSTPPDTHFEIRAVANPKPQLSQGKVLSGWPEATLASQIVDVSRR